MQSLTWMLESDGIVNKLEAVEARRRVQPDQTTLANDPVVVSVGAAGSFVAKTRTLHPSAVAGQVGGAAVV